MREKIVQPVASLQYSFWVLVFLTFESGTAITPVISNNCVMESLQQNLQITTWNVLNPSFENENWYARGASQYLHWDEGRKERAVNYLIQLRSDIFSLQETNKDMIQDFVDALNSKYGDLFTFVWHQRNPHQYDGCGTIYNKKLLFLDKEQVYRYESGNHIILATKFTIMGTKETFWSINTHINWRSRDVDLIFLKKVVDKLPGKVKFAMGDTNATEEDVWYSKFFTTQILDIAKEHYGKLPAFSYNSGKEKKWIDFVISWGIEKSQIQKVFVGNNIEKDLELDMEYLPNAAVPSDHTPVTAIVRIN